MLKLHFVTYANNDPYLKTQKLLNESIHRFTDAEVVLHAYNLDTIQNKPWFKHIKDLPYANNPLCVGTGKRDGYFNSWKSFLIHEVYNSMGIDDIVYYVDSSKYYIEGFQQTIEPFLQFLKNELKIYCGSVSYWAHSPQSSFKHSSNLANNLWISTCNNLNVWEYIIPDRQLCETFLEKPHLLNSSVAFTKNELSDSILNEWVELTKSRLYDYPLITFHHTADQSLLNIIAYKYNLKVYINNEVTHEANKNCNQIHKNLNNCLDKHSYFKRIRDL
jgi:hypothetical protein